MIALLLALAQLPQVPACKFVDAVVKTPCAAGFAADQIVPALVPLEAKDLHFTKTVLQKHKLLPEKLAFEFDLSVNVDSLSIVPMAGVNEIHVNARASAEVQITGVVTGNKEHDYKGKKFNVAMEMGGVLDLASAPGAEACDRAPPAWSMLVLGLRFDEIKSLTIAGAHLGARVPDFISDSKTFLGIVNWAIPHLYKNFDQYNARGIPLCLTHGADGKPDCPRDVQHQENLVIRVGKGGADLALDFGHKQGGSPRLSVGDAVPLCGLARGVLADSCLGAIFNSLAGSILPLRRPVPRELLGTDGIFAVAKSLRTTTGAAGTEVTAKVALAKAGQPDFNLEAMGEVRATPVCTHQSFALALDVGLTKLTGSPNFPKWLVDGVARTAINLKLRSHGPFLLPLHPRKVQRIDVEVNTCAVTRALLKTASTDAVANAVARAVLPFEVPAKGALGAAHLPAGERRKLARAVDDLSLVLKEAVAKKGTGNKQQLRVAIQVRKAKQSDSLSTEANLTIATKAECGEKKHVLVLQPAVDQLGAGKLPAWLLGVTVLDLINEAISDGEKVCALGDCISP